MKITLVNPDGLYKSPTYSQAVVVEGGKTIYIGGQMAFCQTVAWSVKLSQ